MACVAVYAQPTTHSFLSVDFAWPAMNQYVYLPSPAPSRAVGSDEPPEPLNKRDTNKPKSRSKKPKRAAKEISKRPPSQKADRSTQEAFQYAPNPRPQPVPDVEIEIVSPGAQKQDDAPCTQQLLSYNFSNPFDSSSLPTDPRSTFYLHHWLAVFGPSRALVSKKKWRSPILQWTRRSPEAILDKLVYGALLYNASVHYLNCFGVWRGLPSSENLSYDSLALRASLFTNLNEALRDPQKASGDNVLTALAFLTYAEAHHPTQSSSRSMHFQGLSRLVALRGGLSALPPAVSHIVGSCTLIYCITADKHPTGPLFDTLPTPHSPLPKSLRSSLRVLAAENKAFFSRDLPLYMHSELVGAARDLHVIARLPQLERNKDLPMSEVAAYDWMFERVTTRLMAAKSIIQDLSEHHLRREEQEMCRHALLIFAYTSLNRLNNPSFYVPRILLSRLTDATKAAQRDRAIDLPDDVLLWIFFIGAYCDEEGHRDGFFLSLLLSGIRRRAWASFEEFESLLNTFLYNTELHQPIALKAWEMSR